MLGEKIKSSEKRIRVIKIKFKIGIAENIYKRFMYTI